MAIVLPNFGEQLGKDIAGLGEGLAHIIDPMMDFHTKFRSAIAENPEILQKLTDYAYLNKGDLGPAGKYIPKDVRESVVKATPSIEARQHRGLTEAFDSIDPEDRQLFLKARAMGVSPVDLAADPIRVKGIKAAMVKHPQLAEFAGFKILTGEGPGKVSEDELVAEMAPAARDFWNMLAPDEKRMTAAAKNGLLGDIHFQESLQYRKERALERVDHYQDSEANSRFNISGGIGSPSGWKKLLYDPKTKARLEKLKTSPAGVMTDDDIELLQMDRAKKEMSAAVERIHNKASTLTLRDAYEHIKGNEKKGIDPDDETNRAIDLHAINSELTYRDLPYQAIYGKAPPTSEKKQASGFHPFKAIDNMRTKLRFINSKTKEEADPELVLQKLEADDRLTGSQHEPGTKPIIPPKTGEGHAISLSDLQPDERRFAVGTLSNARAALARAGADTSAIKDRIVKSSTPQASAYILKELGLQQ